MQKYNITVSPDFKPDKITGWYVFNTCFQKASGLSLHMMMVSDFSELHEAIKAEKIDLIYANPYDAAMLVNDYGFSPLVRPIGKNDECVIVVSADSTLSCIDDLNGKDGVIIAATDDPATNMIGMRMLEPANLDEGNTTTTKTVSFVAVAKQVMQGEAEIGFFLKDAYDELSNLIKSRLKVLAESEISVIYHSLMVGPKLLEQRERLLELLLSMNEEERGKEILNDLEFDGFEEMSEEDAAFMIDLMEALKS